jgi:hypothetical protein
MQVLWIGLGTAQYPWALQDTVGTVGTARGKSDSWVLHSMRGYCRVLWVLWVLQGLGTVGTAGVYCRVYRKLEL